MIDDESDIKEGELPEGFQIIEGEDPVDVVDVVDPVAEEDQPVDPFEEAFRKEGEEVPELNDDAKEIADYILNEQFEDQY